MILKVSKKSRRGRLRRHPVPHAPHRKVGATQDPIVRRRRVDFRRRKLEATIPEPSFD